MHLLNQVAPDRQLFPVIESQTIGRDASTGRYRDRPGQQQADIALSEVDGLLAIRVAWDTVWAGIIHLAVLRIERESYPVYQRQTAQVIWHEHRWWCEYCTRLLAEPAIHQFAEAHVAETQVIVGDAPAACEQLEGKRDRFQAEIAARGLEIGLAFGGGALEHFDDRSAFKFVGVERVFQVGMLL